MQPRRRLRNLAHAAVVAASASAAGLLAAAAAGSNVVAPVGDLPQPSWHAADVDGGVEQQLWTLPHRWAELDLLPVSEPVAEAGLGAHFRMLRRDGSGAEVMTTGDAAGADGELAVSDSSEDNASDLCLPLLTGDVYRVSDTLECYKSFALLDSVRKGQIEALKSTFQLHPYLDIMRNSSQPFFTSYTDLMKELQSIADNVDITTEFAFHYAITSLLKSLRDGHTTYTPKCFQAFVYLQPWVLAARYRSDGTPAVYINSTNPTTSTFDSAIESFWEGRGVKVDQYVGYYVYRINGQDPVRYIQNYGDTYYGTSRVKDARFNQMFPSRVWSGQWTTSTSILSTLRTPSPDMSDIRTYQLISPNGTHFVTVIVPWAAVLDTSTDSSIAEKFTSRDAYYQAYCVDQQLGSQPTPPSPSIAVDAAEFAGDLLQADVRTVESWRVAMTKLAATRMTGSRPNVINPRWSFKKATKVMKSYMTVASARLSSSLALNDGSSFNLDNPLVKDTTGAFFNLDGTTGVWVLASFMPSATDSSSVSAYIAAAVSGLSTLRNAGITKLIIDVSNNGGGIICAAAAFLSYLFPNSSFIEYDMRRSPLLDTLMQLAVQKSDNTSFYSPLGLLLSDGSSSTTPVTKLDQIAPNTASYLITRGGVTSNYTARFTMDCREYISN
ncbi:hypothetical protein HK405_004509, partial [Cladochytrium tenue]